MARHAERYDITDLATSHTVLLTEKGKQDAIAFGRRLAAGQTDAVLFHSPVPRCRQTAEGIARGLDTERVQVSGLSPLAWLGGDPLAIDTGFADDHIRTHGVDGFLRSWFDGLFPPERVIPLAEAARFQMRELLAQAELGTSLVVDITHDWNLMVVLEYYFRLRHEENGTPVFLDHLTVTASGAYPTARYHGREVEISRKTLEPRSPRDGRRAT